MNIKITNPEKLFLIAGLGNPGEKYAKTRHNAGFLFLDALADKIGEKWHEDKKLKSQIIKQGNLILLKPQTYMNRSGQALEATMNYYKLLEKKLFTKVKNSDLSQKLLVVHDDLDIDFSKYKFSIDSRAAGNNGVQSIIDHLKTKNFTRLRIGIKNEILTHVSAKDFVLQRFSSNEMKILKEIIEEIVDNQFS